MGRNFKKIIGVLLAFVFVLIANQIPYTEIINLPPVVTIAQSDIENINNNKTFGAFVSVQPEGSVQASINGDISVDSITFKLFGFLNLKTVDVNVLQKGDVYVGGNVVGFSLNSEGVIIVGSNSVLTKDGRKNTTEGSNVKVGDSIVEIEGQKIEEVSDISKVINKEENKGKSLKMKLVRKGKKMDSKITPALDNSSKKYKMGLWVRDDVTGVGTLTYVRKDNGRFGSLGHAIADTQTKRPVSIDKGEMFKASVVGLKKAGKGNPGELKGLFLQGKNVLGKVDKNNKFGVFGKIEGMSAKFNSESCLGIGGRLTARPGKAKIRSCIDGKTIEEFDIQIIKTNYQSNSKEKSMVIKVTDKDLIAKTGGIVQGMSGSPIIQNGKVVGAVTHVFVNDPKKGFGVYLDWMIDQ